MTAVWELDLPDSDKLVLLALADCANDEGHCWPSVRSLTIKCSKSERTIQGSIKRLVDEGHLIRREVPGKGCNYTVLPRNSCAPAKNAPPQGTTPTPAESADKPSRTINSEAKASSQRVSIIGVGWQRSTGSSLRVLDASRRQTIRLRLKEHGEDRLKLAFDRMAGIVLAPRRGQGQQMEARSRLRAAAGDAPKGARRLLRRRSALRPDQCGRLRAARAILGQPGQRREGRRDAGHGKDAWRDPGWPARARNYGKDGRQWIG
jgi:hypothetical protein